MQQKMQMKWPLFLTLLATAWLLPLQSQAQDLKSQTPSINQEVNSFIAGWVNDYNGGQLDKLSARFAADAVMVRQDGSNVVGQEAIGAYYGSVFQSIPKRTLTTVQTDIVSLPGDYAQVSGTFQVNGTNSDGTLVQQAGNYNSLLKKDGGAWKMVRHYVMAPTGR